MATQSVCPKEPGPARDEFLKNLMDDLNCHMAKVTAQWGDRPIASEQDMVEAGRHDCLIAVAGRPETASVRVLTPQARD